jgi:asparagine synthase (glutamine-hydrolysing)
LVRHLYSAGLPARRTVLTDIDELLPGFSVDLAGTADRQRPCWSPWDHVRAPEPEHSGEAADRLRRTIIQCVTGWTSSSNKLLLSVSGGLDSSIVAACLKAAGAPDVHCLTMFSNDAGGDERDYARALCQKLDLPLRSSCTGWKMSTSRLRSGRTCLVRSDEPRPTPMNEHISKPLAISERTRS